MTYTARDPGLVWTLHDLGLLDRESAERNERQWDVEWEHLEVLWMQAQDAWKELPLLTRLRLGFSPGQTAWLIRWREEHDPWGRA